MKLIVQTYYSRDRFRTAINVLGDSYGAGIVEHMSRNDIFEDDQDDEPMPLEDVPKNPKHNRGYTDDNLNGIKVDNEPQYHNTGF